MPHLPGNRGIEATLISSVLFGILPKQKKIINILLFGEGCRVLEKMTSENRRASKTSRQKCNSRQNSETRAQVDTKLKKKEEEKTECIY